MFRTARLLALNVDLQVAANAAGEPPSRRFGPVVVAPAYSDGLIRWAPVYWFALGPVVFCWRVAPTSRGGRFFRSVSSAVDWGFVV